MVLSDTGLPAPVFEALRRPSIGTMQPSAHSSQGSLPGLLIVSLQTWTLVEAWVRLQTLTSNWLEGTCKGHKPGKGGFRGEDGKEVKHYSGTETHKQLRELVCRGRRWGAGTEVI